jgi:hypothetical protein
MVESVYAEAVMAELRRELADGHPLSGVDLNLVARRPDSDDILVRFLDGSNRVAEVHLTWRHAVESPPFPGATIYDSIDAWMAACASDPAA